MSDFTIHSTPLPSNFKGGYQKWFEAIVDRMEVTSESAEFIIQAATPTSNQGPWLRGKQWWVWDEDTSTYVPLDLTPSLGEEEIFVGDEPPDTTSTKRFPTLWLKTSNNTKVLGLYTWFGSEVGWVTEVPELQPNSITNLMLQDDCVSERNLQDGCVTNPKLPDNISFAKFEIGPANNFLRMNEAGSNPEYRVLSFTLPLTSFTTSVHQTLTIPHGITFPTGVRPSFFRAVLVCNEAEKAFSPGDEVLIMAGIGKRAGAPPSIGDYPDDSIHAIIWPLFRIDDTNVYIHIRRYTDVSTIGAGAFRLWSPPDWKVFLPDPAKWQFRIYIGIG